MPGQGPRARRLAQRPDHRLPPPHRRAGSPGAQMTKPHPNAHEYLYDRGTSLCRACKAPRDHFIHQLPLVELTMSPLNGMTDPQQFCITVKDGLELIARVYVSAEDF